MNTLNGYTVDDGNIKRKMDQARITDYAVKKLKDGFVLVQNR